jgi:hypothetical protein
LLAVTQKNIEAQHEKLESSKRELQEEVETNLQQSVKADNKLHFVG